MEYYRIDTFFFLSRMSRFLSPLLFLSKGMLIKMRKKEEENIDRANKNKVEDFENVLINEPAGIWDRRYG